MKRFLATLLVSLLLTLSGPLQASALGILPRASVDCDTTYKDDAAFKKAFDSKDDFFKYATDAKKREDVLGCAVKSGRIKFYMVPIYITYLVEFLLEIAGLVAVLFVVYGGYLYVVGGLGPDSDKGKQAIQHALLGLVIALSAWIVVNFVQIALTS